MGKRNKCSGDNKEWNDGLMEWWINGEPPRPAGTPPHQGGELECPEP